LEEDELIYWRLLRLVGKPLFRVSWQFSKAKEQL
jgi:hypothetical protein